MALLLFYKCNGCNFGMQEDMLEGVTNMIQQLCQQELNGDEEAALAEFETYLSFGTITDKHLAAVNLSNNTKALGSLLAITHIIRSELGESACPHRNLDTFFAMGQCHHVCTATGQWQFIHAEGVGVA
jgi:hypothetical protein